MSGEADAPEGGRWPWRIAGEVSAIGDAAEMAEADVRLGGEARALQARGRLALTLGAAPTLDADLKAKSLNFDALLRRDKETSATPARAAAAFAALAGRALKRDAALARFSLKLESGGAYLGARLLETPTLALSGAPGGEMRLQLAERSAGTRALVARRRAGAWRRADFPRPRRRRSRRCLRPRRLGRQGRCGLGRAAGDARRRAAAGRDLGRRRRRAFARRLRRARADAEDRLVAFRRRRSSSACPRRPIPAGSILDLATDALDIDAAPNVEAGLDWLGDSDLDFRLKADKLRVARVGLAAVQSGSLAVRAHKTGQKLTLEKLSLADFGGAAVEAEGESAPTGRWARVKLDAGRLGDFAALLARAAPGPLTRWLQSRAEELGSVKANFEARRDGPPLSQPFSLDFLKSDGVVAGSRFSVTLSRAPAPVDAVSVQATLDAPDAGALLRKLGANISGRRGRARGAGAERDRAMGARLPGQGAARARRRRTDLERRPEPAGARSRGR